MLSRIRSLEDQCRKAHGQSAELEKRLDELGHRLQTTEAAKSQLEYDCRELARQGKIMEQNFSMLEDAKKGADGKIFRTHVFWFYGIGSHHTCSGAKREKVLRLPRAVALAAAANDQRFPLHERYGARLPSAGVGAPEFGLVAEE